MNRPLTARERGVLAAMIDNAVEFDDDRTTITPRHRASWREQTDSVQVGGMCSCGSCPTIDLVDERGATPHGPRVTLSASHKDRGLLLFIDGGKLSCLELYSHTDEAVETFPPPHELEF